MKELEQFLLDRAMEHDSPALLFNLAAEYLISAKVIRPGVVTLMEMVGVARAGAGELTLGHVAVRPGGVGTGIAGEVQDRRGTGRAREDRRGAAVAVAGDPAGAGRPGDPGRAGGRPVARADRDAAAAGGCGGRMEAASA